ncbi:uncharacterized protein LOC129005527 [Macrosteles quadrilineatus]|uniref:uncharacterized protein LOC129005527 n=1 Tax=Macrosteles quadrilineatus TaxID=74068 RepID=UPI0023E09717|nr:uncharacterized protein LOC129005527 [Macrosteles quadrilineatus]
MADVKDVVECPVCDKRCLDNDRAIFCNGMCHSWHHAKCVNITVKKYSEIQKVEDFMKWFCPVCDVKLRNYISRTNAESELASTAVEIIGISTTLLSVYRSPDGPFETFITQLELCLDFLSKLYSRLIVCGDFNVHLERPSREESIFVNLLRSFDLHITSRDPTRRSACLDAIATNINSWDHRTEVVKSLVADHDGAVLMSLVADQVRTQPAWCDNYLIKKRVIDKTNLPTLCKELGKVDWDSIQHIQHAESAFSVFSTMYQDKFDEIFPLKVCKFKSTSNKPKPLNSNKSWYTPQLAAIRSHMILVHDHYKLADDDNLKARYFLLYTKIKQHYSSEVRNAKKAHNVKVISESTNACKAAWGIVNEHRKQTPGPIAVASPDEFNNFFVKVADDIISDLPLLQHQDPLHQLDDFSSNHTLTHWNKILETVMKIQLMAYLENNNLLSEAQHGFRSGRSTTTALTFLVEKITEAFEQSESVLLRLCDLSKAFDVVSHDLLIAKLRKYGVGGAVLDTLSCYLADRKQVGSLNGASSCIRDVPHGVPQGSVLGPILFSLMINDLWLNGSTMLFADDTTLISQGKDIGQVRTEADHLLERAKDWFNMNRFKLNEDKTQSLLCTLKLDPH